MGSSLEADDDTLDVGDGIFEEADGSLRNRDNRGFSKEYRGVAKNTRKNIPPPSRKNMYICNWKRNNTYTMKHHTLWVAGVAF